MPTQQTVLLLGGTGRTGQRVLEQLLNQGVIVRAIVRSIDRLPAAVAGHPGLSVVEADLLSLSDTELVRQSNGCDAIVSCLGHIISLKGVFGPPRDLVTRAVRRLCRAVETAQPKKIVKFVLMSSVSVNDPVGLDTRRGFFETLFLRMLSFLIPPAMDNQRAADFLHNEIRTGNPFVQWVAVRPDTLLEGTVSEYSVHESIVSSIFRPEKTTMSNVAHFMSVLVTDPDSWDRWQGKLPVVINDTVSRR